jgi:hypothetical protein
VAYPWGLALDQNGNLLEADYVGSRVRKIDPSGIITTFAGSPSDGGDGGPAVAAVLNAPDATAPDGKGGVVVLEG